MMKRNAMSIRIRNDLPEPVWRGFVDRHPAGNVFHTPEMFQVFARAAGHEPRLWAAVDGDGAPLALLPVVQITQMGGPLRPLTTRAVAYGSVLCDSGPAGTDALEALLQAHDREAGRQALFTELRNLSDLEPLQGTLEERGYRYEPHLNYLVDLARAPEAVLQSFSRRTRKQIRRALRQGHVTVRDAADRKEVRLCYRLLQKSYAAARVPLADRSLFDAAFDVLNPVGMVRFLLAWVGDACVAASVELLHRDTVYGWYGGVDRAYGSYVPNEVLMWHILRWGAENGYRRYDFGGAGKPDEDYGVRDFKAKFGGELVCYGRNTCVHAPLRLAASRAGYQMWRRLAGFRAWAVARAGTGRDTACATPSPGVKKRASPTHRRGQTESKA
jgi:CelD/BcsL family acetyltransferase involved in cellulose biosynthesis